MRKIFRMLGLYLIILFVGFKSSVGQIDQLDLSLVPVEKVDADDCQSTEYFDLIYLKCINCPEDSFTLDTDKFNCVCNKTFYYNYNNGGGSVSCKPCRTGFEQSLDGFSCVETPAANFDCDPTSFDQYQTDLEENGAVPATMSRRCVRCNRDTSVSTGSACKSCKPLVFIESPDVDIGTVICSSEFTPGPGGDLFLTSAVAGQPNFFRCPFDDASTCESWFFTTYAPFAYRQCRLSTRPNKTACHQLANMCTLNLYGHNSPADRIDVCKAHDTLYNQQFPLNSYIPWLRYAQKYGEYKENYLLNGTASQFIKIKFSSSCNLSPQLNLYTAEYGLYGNFIRLTKFDVSKLQLCSLVSNLIQFRDKSPFSTTYFSQSCSLNVRTLFELADSTPATFYEMYLSYGNESVLLPVPVKILNYRSIDANVEVNKEKEDNHQHHRRFFLYDAVSSKERASSASRFIRYARSISIKVELIDGRSDGEILPPVIVIDYATARRDASVDTQVDVNFSIEYLMNVQGYWAAIYISIGVLGGLALFWTVKRIWNWNRRSGRIGCDLVVVIKFITFLFGMVANALCVVIVAGSIYWLAFYKGQSYALLFLPVESQESFTFIFIVVAFALKLIDTLNMILQQTSYNIFFIDWEKPKVEQIDPYDDLGVAKLAPVRPQRKADGEKKVINDAINDEFLKDQLKNQNKISCWRTLFVANEWNELQTFRKTSLTLQLIFVLFLLKVVNLEALAHRDCSSSIMRDANEYTPPFSSILRVGIGSSIYIAVWLIQLAFYRLIYIRCFEDKIGEFVDFCSVSNISMFLMTHSQFGYYIHGRSPHGHSDTSMQQMTKSLAKEENDMTIKRGLENGSDHQTFSISVPSKLTRQYFKVIKPLYNNANRRAIRLDQSTSSNEFEKRMLAYTQLNKFLMSFINNTLRDLNYRIVHRTLLESILDIEFRAPIECSYFYKDDETCFTKAIFYGKEISLMILDLLTFLLVDYVAQNFILAAFVVFILANFMIVIRSDLGRRNISKKTLVSKRFLF